MGGLKLVGRDRHNGYLSPTPQGVGGLKSNLDLVLILSLHCDYILPSLLQESRCDVVEFDVLFGHLLFTSIMRFSLPPDCEHIA